MHGNYSNHTLILLAKDKGKDPSHSMQLPWQAMAFNYAWP